MQRTLSEIADATMPTAGTTSAPWGFGAARSALEPSQAPAARSSAGARSPAGVEIVEDGVALVGVPVTGDAGPEAVGHVRRAVQPTGAEVLHADQVSGGDPAEAADVVRQWRRRLSGQRHKGADPVPLLRLVPAGFQPIGAP